jgi:hypothetical protein
MHGNFLALRTSCAASFFQPKLVTKLEANCVNGVNAAVRGKRRGPGGQDNIADDDQVVIDNDFGTVLSGKEFVRKRKSEVELDWRKQAT